MNEFQRFGYANGYMPNNMARPPLDDPRYSSGQPGPSSLPHLQYPNLPLQAMPLVSMPNPGPPVAAAGTPGVRVRSAMACNLCRRQKMKCEGPSFAPCKRCRNAKVECIFEQTAEGKGKEEASVENRTLELERRVASLENEKTAAFESRIAFLEGELALLRNHPYPPQQHDPPPSSDYARPNHEGFRRSLPPQPSYQPYDSPANSFPTASSSRAPSWPSPHQPSGPHPDSHPSRPSSNKSSPNLSRPSSSHFEGLPVNILAPHSAPPASSISHLLTGSERWRSDDSGRRLTETEEEQEQELGRPSKVRRLEQEGGDQGEEGDLLGLVTLEEAMSCFAGYFASGSTVAPYSGEGGPFELVRSNSPLLFATLVAIGARILSRVQTLEIASAEALRLAELDFHPAKASSLWDLKALVLLGLYFGSPLLVPRIVALATEHRLPEAFSDLMDEREKSEVEEAALIEKGRLALMIWTYERCYTTLRGKPALSQIPSDVIEEHVRILRASRFTRPHVDVFLGVYIENLSIVASAQARLDRVTRLSPLHRDELVEIVGELLGQLDGWWRRHGDWLDASTRALDDHTRAAIPFHHARFFILDSAFARMPTPEQFATDPQLLGYALDALGQGKAVLDLASQSRIWHSHSPFAVHFQSVSLAIIPVRLVAFASVLPTHVDLSALRKTFNRTILMLERFSSALSTPEQRGQAGEIRALVRQLEALSGAEGSAEEHEFPEEAKTMDQIVALLHASEEVMHTDVSFWHELLGGELVTRM